MLESEFVGLVDSIPPIYSKVIQAPVQDYRFQIIQARRGSLHLRIHKDYAPKSVVCGFVRVTMHGIKYGYARTDRHSIQ